MLSFRITKYDPSARDASGAYLRDDWTSWSDIGRSFGGVLLTNTEYDRVESAYVAVAAEFLREGGVEALAVMALETRDQVECPVTQGSIINLAMLGPVLRGMLREQFWCRLESSGGFVHVGYDYYMYIGVPRIGPRAQALAQSVSLFVEEFVSPYGVAGA